MPSACRSLGEEKISKVHAEPIRGLYYTPFSPYVLPEKGQMIGQNGTGLGTGGSEPLENQFHLCEKKNREKKEGEFLLLRSPLLGASPWHFITAPYIAHLHGATPR